MKLLRELADNASDFTATVGGVTLFLGRLLGQVPRALLRPSLVIDQRTAARGLDILARSI